MKLITSKTTLAAFSTQDEWLVKEPKTGAVYQMKIGQLYGVGHHLRVTQTIQHRAIQYIKRCGAQLVLITDRRALLSIIKGKQFDIG